MRSTAESFPENAGRALADGGLQRALGKLQKGFPVKRAEARARLPEFDSLRDEAVAIREHALRHLDHYLVRFEERVVERGGRVHWARDAAEARAIITGICRDAGARTVTKSKSMIGEEIAINEHLAANGITPVETDLGEYIIQIRNEPPSHLIAPAIHLSMGQVADSFRATHAELPAGRPLDEPRALMEEARAVLRGRFLAADVGLTGANALVAETGSVVLVTNEGNADLTMTLPRVHIALASLEKVVPTLEDATTLLRVLARSATGQEFAVYTSVVTGPRRAADLDGPEELHVVILDNGRGDMLGGPFHDMLRCIRCGACLNHCPVYAAVGGHAYGWVYSGPMGAVLTPYLIGLDAAGHLPNASTLCGRCEEVCPVRIPLPAMLRRWRERQAEQRKSPWSTRAALSAWAFVAVRPRLYRALAGIGVAVLAALGRRAGSFKRLPLAGGWTTARDLPAPEGRTFMAAWKARRGGRP